MLLVCHMILLISELAYQSCLIHWAYLRRIFCSFMPIHIGAETDLRFVYCAGEEHCPLFKLV
jgi:hypothetical protein